MRAKCKKKKEVGTTAAQGVGAQQNEDGCQNAQQGKGGGLDTRFRGQKKKLRLPWGDLDFQQNGGQKGGAPKSNKKKKKALNELSRELVNGCTEAGKSNASKVSRE